MQEALQSFKRLEEILAELTEEEVLACLELEAASRRRRSLIDRLISRAVRLQGLVYSSQLKEKFHGTRIQQDSPGEEDSHSEG